MTRTSDLLPQTSGSASLGVNQVNQTGFDIGSMTPYNHVHLTSGVIHDPANGQSGVIRFAQYQDRSYINATGHHGGEEFIIAGRQSGFEFSVDGGETFPILIGATKTLSVGEFNQQSQAVITTSLDPLSNFPRDLLIHTSGNLNLVGRHNVNIISNPTSALDGILISTSGKIVLGAGSTLQSFALEIQENANAGYQVLTGLAGTLGTIDLIPMNFRGRLVYRAYNSYPHEAWWVKYLHDTGGPFNDGFWPLPHSGQIATMIAAAAGGSADLQIAYDNGNEIDQSQRALSPGALADGAMVIGQVPVLIKHATPGAGNTNGSRSLRQGREDAGVIASGFSLTPNLPNTFAYGALGPGFLHLQSSGTASTAPRGFLMGLGNVGSVAEGLGLFATDANLQWTVRGLLLSTDGGEGDGNIEFLTGNPSTGLGGQIQLSPFDGSGVLEFRLGPHQAWHAKLSHSNTGGPDNDGFWPMPHSGQMLEQIARAIKTKAITIERPAVNNDLTIWYTNEAITVHEVESVVRGAFDASGAFAIRHSTSRSLAGTELTTNVIECTSRSTGQITSSFASPNIPADSWIWIGVSGVSGVATSQMNVTIQYR